MINKLLSTLLLFLFLSIGCNNPTPPAPVPYQVDKGETMGTYYVVQYQYGENLKIQIDSLLVDFNNELSTYIPTSLISQTNGLVDSICFEATKTKYFQPSLMGAQKIWEETGGAFDPTVMPLVNYWGFGYTERKKVTTIDQDSIQKMLQLVGLDKVTWKSDTQKFCIRKANPKMKLDLSASAKGHGVDVIADYLKSLGISNFLVEIGGEVHTSGSSAKGTNWVIGINVPDESSAVTDVALPVQLNNEAMATSGNYRNNYKNGQFVVAHIIDPKTGLSRPTDILSASIIAPDCLTADALATATMVMGKEAAINFFEKHKQYDYCLLLPSKDSTKFEIQMSDGFRAKTEVK